MTASATRNHAAAEGKGGNPARPVIRLLNHSVAAKAPRGRKMRTNKALCPAASANLPFARACIARSPPHPGQCKPVIEWKAHAGIPLSDGKMKRKKMKMAAAPAKARAAVIAVFLFSCFSALLFIPE